MSELVWLRYCWLANLFVCYMFVFFLFVCFFIALGYKQEVFLNVLWRYDLFCLRYCWFAKLFVCFFVCVLFFVHLFVCFNHLKIPTGKFTESFYEDLIWFVWYIVDLQKLCLFELYCDTSRKISWIFLYIWLDLPGILMIHKISCLFVCLFVSFIFGCPKEVFLKFREYLTWFGRDIVDIYNRFCFFVCLFVSLFNWSQDTHGKFSWKFNKDYTWFC